VGPHNVVVGEVRTKHATQVAFVEHDDVVETVAPDRADQAFGERILPGSARCDDDLANAHALDPVLEISTVDGIAITEEVSGAGLVRERVDDLLSRPGGGGLVGDADVEEFSAIVTEYHEAEEQAKGQGRYDEEVDGRDVVTVGSQEGPPRRRRVTGGTALYLATVRAATLCPQGGHARASAPDIVGRADERQADIIHTPFETEAQIVQVLVAQDRKIRQP
jgi:hypothetical protein